MAVSVISTSGSTDEEKAAAVLKLQAVQRGKVGRRKAQIKAEEADAGNSMEGLGVVSVEGGVEDNERCEYKDRCGGVDARYEMKRHHIV